MSQLYGFLYIYILFVQRITNKEVNTNLTSHLVQHHTAQLWEYRVVEIPASLNKERLKAVIYMYTY